MAGWVSIIADGVGEGLGLGLFLNLSISPLLYKKTKTYTKITKNAPLNTMSLRWLSEFLSIRKLNHKILTAERVHIISPIGFSVSKK